MAWRRKVCKKGNAKLFIEETNYKIGIAKFRIFWRKKLYRRVGVIKGSRNSNFLILLGGSSRPIKSSTHLNYN